MHFQCDADNQLITDTLLVAICRYVCIVCKVHVLMELQLLFLVVMNVVFWLWCMQVFRRGMWPEGDGEVVFSCPCVRKMQPVFQLDEGKVKRIRGIAYPHS